MIELTYEEAHRLFRYEPDTGKLFWAVSRKGINLGDEAGSIIIGRRTIYRRVMINRKRYYVHRIVWLLNHGKWPEGEIDHVDGDGCNNRIENLRDVPRIINQRNSRMRCNNTSGISGVCFDKHVGKWKAQLHDGSGKQKNLGRFTDIRDAEKAVREFQASYGYTERHGKNLCA